MGLTSYCNPKEELERELSKLDLTEEEFDLAISHVLHYYNNPENIINPIDEKNFKTEKEKLAFQTIQFIIANFFGTKIASELGDDFELFSNCNNLEKNKLLKTQSYIKDKILVITNSLNKRRILHNSDKEDVKYYMCPVYGRISAGIPNWAEECIEGRIPIDPELMNILNPEECFFLKVNGESMNKVVKNGAFALIRKQEVVENGEIAVVLVDRIRCHTKKVF